MATNNPNPNYRIPSQPTNRAPVPITAQVLPAEAQSQMGRMQQAAQDRIPLPVNNGNPRGANNMRSALNARYPVPEQVGQRPSFQRQQYFNAISGQQGDLGRYRPPTLAGDGNDPMNWNDYGGYAYNLPYAFGPNTFNQAPGTSGPYGGYPNYLIPNWNRPLPNWG